MGNHVFVQGLTTVSPDMMMQVQGSQQEAAGASNFTGKCDMCCCHVQAVFHQAFTFLVCTALKSLRCMLETCVGFKQTRLSMNC